MYSHRTTDSLAKQDQWNQRFGLPMENSFREPPASNKKISIYSALYQDDAHLSAFGDCTAVYHPSDLTNTNSILILHGGADISPSIYNHPVSRYTQADKHLSTRDTSEVLLAKKAIELGIPIFGICRGAQLACALAGGSLVQHVEGHVGGSHGVETSDGKIYLTSTCHHQMMNPWQIDHELLAWSAPSKSSIYIVENDKEIDMKVEPEVVFFPKIKALAIQGHPEWMATASPFVQYCLSLVEEKLL